jgi:hypothetical protein
VVSGEPASPAAPKQVSRFEASLLRILRFFFRQVPAEEALPLVRATQNQPNCLTAAAVHLVRDTLAKGCVLHLVRAGGWKKDRYLRNGEPKVGRLWERSKVDDLKLDFSRHSLEFLIWLTAETPSKAKGWKAPAAELTAADHLLLFLAYEALSEEQDVAAALRGLAAFAENPLCRLAYPGDLADATDEVPAFDSLFQGTGALILEALQPALEARWLEIERGKGQLGDWDRMRARGRAELGVLAAFLDAADRAGRWDLARFLLGVLAKVLATPDMTPAFWTGGLQGGGPPRLADRLETQRSALALLRSAERFRDWERRSRTRGFMDEDYAAAKFWLGEWERYNGDETTVRAERVVQMLEPLRTNTD